VEDPYAEEEDVLEQYGLHLTKNNAKDYDAVVITVPHNQYRELNNDYFAAITKPEALIADLKGIYKNKITNRKYWSL
jgi:UDP-N-acetyl-D-glucosamine/UDP-N-acetyl-D-galactosamine dehydrogenase